MAPGNQRGAPNFAQFAHAILRLAGANANFDGGWVKEGEEAGWFPLLDLLDFNSAPVAKSRGHPGVLKIKSILCNVSNDL